MEHNAAMIANLDLMILLLEKVGIAALVILIYRVIRRSALPIFWTGPAIGFVFAIGALIVMIDPVVLAPGVVVDLRGVMVALAALFGGVSAAVICAAATIIYRVYSGGAGALSGVVGIVLSALIALVYAHLSDRRRDLPGLALLGLMLSFSMVSLLFLPRAVILPFLHEAGVAMVLRNLLGTVLIGYALASEDRLEQEFADFKREASLDPLTRLHNRRYLEAISARWRAEPSLAGERFAVILFDIDHFKRLNDTHGHAAGDLVLSRVASIIETRMRRSDFVVRYGGEEIAVVMPATSSDQAQRVAENIRERICEEPFMLDSGVVSVAASAGVAGSVDGHESIYDVLKRADRALYEAKGAGRNRVILFTPGL
ncbi:diguanylate cyclase [Martelella alba]|uniref:diguanylate cyclase n=1 Tax=Martelella alba TaxID=2590451 RepID=A0A506UJR7_9HYPH|nr:diguanylate cyclase [Martelella alba]TPW33548.1 diguanylate cyclase [Martelella alba]